ncbi:MAG: DUF192 domain-containing protein, partial [Candidatus Komeilibacteria bacterium]|nr:DUF192 domain-containing protein [Candidatus Komeilibacteria bacterium]
MKKLFIALTLLLILSGCARPNSLPTKKIVMNGQSVLVEVAQTPEARNQGLSGRSSLCSNCGMLFTFGQLDQYTFW